ncbi:dTDP-4-dehydrorhamnose 3,5-epimerase [Psychroserpens sp. NJDZ02]|uniref:dTDP-4-dehydrorhamnose 3,5-epimerase n=1 Tax=Psychroserpens sp. NJDZ02 TaxID=2570561 RepID=UPI0010A92A55|nr:dTDP-4-dehydrorhamnose 3,5-epimerase [Psychroserpens sp. NJDZ02]QCE41163.1 dTDP-4-dehydrorhamnose 3,5-epimerase [Psychroserpens sp. NJDZ02]
MQAIETKLKGCFVLEPTVFGDSRGYFFESYNKHIFDKLINQNITFIQDNESYSSKGVLRGLHNQRGEYSQAKLVRVTQGEVLDVAVDFRPDSATYLQHVSVKLSSENKKQLFIPRGFLHGFVVLSETAVFNYKCDNWYQKEAELGVIYNDPKLNIDWLLDDSVLLISEKDKVLPTVSNI